MLKSARLLAVLLSGALIAAACGADTPSPVSGDPSASVAPPAGGLATPEPLPSEPSAPTSETLIATALAAGTITHEQSLVYRALALFGSEELPEAYRSPVHEMHAGVELFGEIDAGEASLSPATLEKLAPYRVRPSDPLSIFNAPGAVASRGIVLAVAAAGPSWKSLAVPGTGARVWVKDSAGADGQLATYSAALARVWQQMPGIFTYPKPDKISEPLSPANPDSATDFYFVDVGGLDPRRSYCVRYPEEPNCRFSPVDNGIAMRTDIEGHKSSGYLLIDAAVQGDQLLDTIAHELTHAAQFAYDVNDASWLMESTATWAAFRVMKKLQVRPAYAYAYLEDFFAGLDQPLTRLDNKNAYGSWLYFLFASMEEGDGIVTTIWQQAADEGEDGAFAVDEAFAFDEHFDDFSVRDWNKDPVERQYKTADDTFPTDRKPDLTRDTAITGAEENLLDATVAQLSSAYYRYEFDSGVRNVIVENGYAGVENAHLWAIRKVFGVWQTPEDWTNEVKKEFCRDIEEQDVSELILIVSNASMRAPLPPPDPAKVVTKSLGCPGWNGTMTATRTWSQLNGGVLHTGTTTSTFTGLWKPDGPDATPIFSCSQVYPPQEPCIVYRPIGTITWTWDSEYPPLDPQPGCKANTSGSFDAGDTRFPDTQSLVLQPIGNDKIQYRGVGAIAIEPQKCPDPISGGGNAPAFFDIIENASSDAPPDDTGDTCFHTTWVIDASADTIAGSCSRYVYSYHSLRYEWNLKRVGKAVPPG